MADILIGREDRDTDTHREETGVALTQGKECKGLLATPEAKTGMEHILPQNRRREPNLPTPGFQTSSLQNTQRINFCGLKHPVCGTLLTAALET